MKIKSFLLLITMLFVISGTAANAQSSLAKFKYEDAEKAYNNKNYVQCVKLLDETQKMLGKGAPNISYLRIMARSHMIAGKFEDIQKWKDEIDYYLKHYDIPGLEDKLRDVYDLKQRIDAGQVYPKTEAEFARQWGAHFAFRSKWKSACNWYLKAAKLGDTVSQKELGHCYFYGRGVEQSYADALQWYLTASSKTTLGWEAERNVAYSYQMTRKNLAMAIKWYGVAAAAHDIYSAYQVASWYEIGGRPGFIKDEKVACKYYRMAANEKVTNDWYLPTNAMITNADLKIILSNNSAKAKNKAYKASYSDIKYLAKYKYAYHLENGLGCEQDLGRAIGLYESIDEYYPGYVEANRRLGYIYLDGKGGIQIDYNQAVTNFKRACYGGGNNNPNDYLRVGYTYLRWAPHNSSHYDALLSNAESYFEDAFKKATQDSLKGFAATELGFTYQQWFVHKKRNSDNPDYHTFNESISWFENAAKYNDSYGLVELGKFYYDDSYRGHSYAKAKEMFEKSTNPFAKVGLAVMYYTGHGVKRDRDQAVQLYKEARKLSKNLTLSGDEDFVFHSFYRDETRLVKFLQRKHPELLN